MVTESYSNKNTTIKMIMNYSESFQLYATYVAGKSKCIRYTLYIASCFNPITFSVESLVRNHLNCAHAVYTQSVVWQRQSDQFMTFALLIIVIDFC